MLAGLEGEHHRRLARVQHSGLDALHRTGGAVIDGLRFGPRLALVLGHGIHDIVLGVKGGDLVGLGRRHLPPGHQDALAVGGHHGGQVGQAVGRLKIAVLVLVAGEIGHIPTISAADGHHDLGAVHHARLHVGGDGAARLGGGGALGDPAPHGYGAVAGTGGP